MRTFIAIEISEETRNALAQIESHLKYAGADIKWVRPEIAHLTLKFLGEIDDDKAVRVGAVLDSIARTTRPFEIRVKNIGAFPKIDHPRVIWIGLDKGVDETTALFSRIDNDLSEIGFTKETRPFSPHLTIGRVRSPLNRDKLIEKISSAAASIDMSRVPKYQAHSVILFHSTLTPQGSTYTKLHESRFRLS